MSEMMKQVRDFFKYKPSNKKEQEANPTNVKVGIGVLRKLKEEKRKQREAYERELGNSGPKP